MSDTALPFDRPLYWPEIIESLAEILAEDDIWLVGGVVRDVYLRRPVHDIDLTSPVDGRRIARHIANTLGGHYYSLDDERRVGRALLTWQETNYIIDVAQFRTPTLIEDLKDRDFTVNALAVNLQELDKVIDPTNGLQDIRAKLVRPCSEKAIENDPVRAIRAVRLGISHQLHLTPEAKAACRAAAAKLSTISQERIRDEFFKLLETNRPHAGLVSLDILGILAQILPETQSLKGLQQSPPHVFDVWRHTLSVVEHMSRLSTSLSNRRDDNSSANFAMGMAVYGLAHLRGSIVEHLQSHWPNDRSHRALLNLAALAHDIAKPTTQTVGQDQRIHFYQHEVHGGEIAKAWAKRLALSNGESERLQLIVRHHMRPAQLTRNKKLSRRASYRFWRDTGLAGVDICLLSIADQLGKFGNTLPQAFWLDHIRTIQQLLDGYFEDHESLVDIKPFINGDDIMAAFDVMPGPFLGQVIQALKEAQALGEFSDRESALRWVENWLADQASP